MAISLTDLKREKIRREAWRDLFVFARTVLGYPDVERRPHKEVCDFITGEPDLLEWFKLTPAERADKYVYIKKLLMLHRGSLKSTLATISLPHWALWHDPTLRILVDNEVSKNSRGFLSEIKVNIEKPRVTELLTLDGENPVKPLYKEPGGWTDNSIRIVGNTTKEPSIATAGVDTAATSQHYDIIIMDDIVSERNVTTPEQMEKVKNHYEMAYSLLEPGGLLIVIGTRYHLDDLYATLIDDKTFQHYIRPAIDDEGKIFFPKKFNKARLDDLKRTQNKNFYSQYMLTPVGGEDTVFKEEDIKDIDIKEVPSNVYTFITVDLAISQKETADYTVLAVSQIDSKGNIYIVDMAKGRFTPVETISELFDLVDKWEPMDVGIESVAFQKSMIYFTKDEMRRRGRFFNIKELKADRDKMRRAKTLQPFVENGMFHVVEHVKNKGLVDEMATFPYAKHDDMVDAVTYIPQIMKKPSDNKYPKQSKYKPRNSITGY